MGSKQVWVPGVCLTLVLLTSACPKGRLDYKQGRQAELEKDRDTALIHYERALKQDPANIEYQLKAKRARFEAAQMHVDRGHKLRDQGQLEAAIAEFEKALAIDPASFIAEQELRRTLEQLAQQRQREGEAAAPARPALSALETAPEAPPELAPLSRTPINLRLTADSQQVFETIAKLAGINVIFDPEFQSRRIPVVLTGATLEQALDIVALMTKTFWKAVTANTIMVIPDTKPKRSAHEEQIIKTIYLSNITTPAELNEVVQTVRTLLEARFITPSTSQNAIILRDTPARVAVAEKIIRDIDRAKPEVLIQVAVLQARRDRARELGILPTTTVPLFPLPRNPVDPATGALTVQELKRVGTGDYAIVLPSATALALLTDSATKVIQNPEVRATDGQTAKLRIGDRVPFAVGSFQAGVVGPTLGGIQTQFQFQDVGVNLDITPRVHSNREISLRITVEVSSVTARVQIGGIDQPIFGQRKIEHDIRLREGEVNVLGGLVERSQVKSIEGWPGLSQVPFLRYLFSSERVETQENELLIVLTPRIIRLSEYSPLNVRALHVGTAENVTLRPAAEPRVPAPPAARPEPPSPPPTQPPQPTPPPETAPEPAAAPQLRFDPARVVVGVGKATSINLMVEAVQDLFSLPLVISFDPKVVELTEVHHGGFLAAGGQPVALVHRVDAESGTAIVSLTRPPGSSGVSGSGTLVTLVFRGLGVGQTALSIVQSDARNTARAPVTLQVVTGEIVVQQ